MNFFDTQCRKDSHDITPTPAPSLSLSIAVLHITAAVMITEGNDIWSIAKASRIAVGHLRSGSGAGFCLPAIGLLGVTVHVSTDHAC